MARNKKSGCSCGGCLVKLLIAILIIVLLIGIAVAVVVNMTPEQLGIADIEFNGTTLRELGLADVKIKEAFKFIKDVLNADSGNIVQNAYIPETEKSVSENNLGAAVNVGTGNNGLVYSDILKDKVVYDEEYLYEYKDTTIAFIFQSMLDEGETAASSESNGAIEFLRDIDGRVDEISIYSVSGGYELRAVVSIDISEFKSEIEARIPFGLVKLPDRIYLVSYSSLSADADGELVTSGKAIRINDVESVISDAIFDVLSGKAEQSVDTDEDLGDEQTVNGLIGEGFAAVILNLGRVGTAEYDADTRAVTGEAVFGVSGIGEHSLTVITYTESTAGVREE